jgi:SAM-dependent methyltransferase
MNRSFLARLIGSYFILNMNNKNLDYSIRRKMFEGGIVGLIINPFYHARKNLHLYIVSYADRITGKTLDVGCGQKPYEKIFHSTEYIGLEVDTPEARKSKKADYFYDGSNFPFSDLDFDSVVSSQVFEHVFNPNLFLSEVNRVLKPGGILLLTVPFIWDEHEQPYDFARYSSFGLQYLLKAHNFEILEHKKTVNDIRIIFQLVNAYLYKIVRIDNRFLKFTILVPFVALFNVLGEALYRFFPRNDDMFLDNVVLAKKI